MKSTPSAPLSRYLSQQSRTGRPSNPTLYIKEGAALMCSNDLSGLHKLLPQVRKKVNQITESQRLRERLDLLVLFYEETRRLGDTSERRETAFVLYYFLKGYDLIPDSIPKIGLLDDALLIDTALQRNLHALQTHWAAQGRPWPTDL
jgi:uncharacterized membrane protein YkvA (DUF1232 family)